MTPGVAGCRRLFYYRVVAGRRGVAEAGEDGDGRMQEEEMYDMRPERRPSWPNPRGWRGRRGVSEEGRKPLRMDARKYRVGIASNRMNPNVRRSMMLQQFCWIPRV